MNCFEVASSVVTYKGDVYSNSKRFLPRRHQFGPNLSKYKINMRKTVLDYVVCLAACCEACVSFSVAMLSRTIHRTLGASH